MPSSSGTSNTLGVLPPGLPDLILWALEPSPFHHPFDFNGAVVIVKNNSPRYLLIEFSSAEKEQFARDKDVASISKRLIEKNRAAYEVLAT